MARHEHLPIYKVALDMTVHFEKLLAYYVEWHMREAWRELMFADADQVAKRTRDPVAPAKRSDAAMKKVANRTLDDGTPVHSLQTLMRELQTIVRNTCRTSKGAQDAATFDLIFTIPTQKQTRSRIDRSHQTDAAPISRVLQQQ